MKSADTQETGCGTKTMRMFPEVQHFHTIAFNSIFACSRSASPAKLHCGRFLPIVICSPLKLCRHVICPQGPRLLPFVVVFCYLQSTSLWGIYSHNTNRFSTTTITRSHTRAYFIKAFSIGQAYYILFVPEVPMSIIINVFVFVISLSPFSMSVCLSVCLCLSAYALSMRLNICRFFALHDTIHVY